MYRESIECIEMYCNSYGLNSDQRLAVVKAYCNAWNAGIRITECQAYRFPGAFRECIRRIERGQEFDVAQIQDGFMHKGNWMLFPGYHAEMIGVAWAAAFEYHRSLNAPKSSGVEPAQQDADS